MEAEAKIRSEVMGEGASEVADQQHLKGGRRGRRGRRGRGGGDDYDHDHNRDHDHDGDGAGRSRFDERVPVPGEEVVLLGYRMAEGEGEGGSYWDVPNEAYPAAAWARVVVVQAIGRNGVVTPLERAPRLVVLRPGVVA